MPAGGDIDRITGQLLSGYASATLQRTAPACSYLIRNGAAMNQYPRAHVLSSLAVALRVTAPATIILTAHEIVRIDRVAQSAAGATAERYGDLLRPGTNTIHLDPGTYHFRTRGGARLHVIDPDSVTANTARSVTCLPPPPDMRPGPGTDAACVVSGSGIQDHVPALTITYGDVSSS
jgi:hypothetical protein